MPFIAYAFNWAGTWLFLSVQLDGDWVGQICNSDVKTMARLTSGHGKNTDPNKGVAFRSHLTAAYQNLVKKFSVSYPPPQKKKNTTKKKNTSSFFGDTSRKKTYWCYYPHQLRDLVFPICMFFVCGILKFLVNRRFHERKKYTIDLAMLGLQYILLSSWNNLERVEIDISTFFFLSFHHKKVCSKCISLWLHRKKLIVI